MMNIKMIKTKDLYPEITTMARLNELTGVETMNEGMKFKDAGHMLRVMLKELSDMSHYMEDGDDKEALESIIKKFQDAYVG